MSGGLPLFDGGRFSCFAAFDYAAGELTKPGVELSSPPIFVVLPHPRQRSPGEPKFPSHLRRVSSSSSKISRRTYRKAKVVPVVGVAVFVVNVVVVFAVAIVIVAVVVDVAVFAFVIVADVVIVLWVDRNIDFLPQDIPFLRRMSDGLPSFHKDSFGHMTHLADSDNS